MTTTTPSPFEDPIALRTRLDESLRELRDANAGLAELQAELVEKSEGLRRAHADKQRVVHNVSHEFRTPLHTILGLARLLDEESDGPLNDEQHKQARFIVSAAEELRELVDDLLDLSKEEHGPAVLRIAPFAGAALCDALRTQIASVAVREDITLGFDERVDAASLETDLAKLASIVRLLVVNALQHTEPGCVAVAARLDGDELVVSVVDGTSTMASSQLARAFDPFASTPPTLAPSTSSASSSSSSSWSATRTPSGARTAPLRLALALAKKLADELGGALSVASELGRGTTFTLRVPLVHPDAHTASPASQSFVLVVDTGDAHGVDAIERALETAGMPVVIAHGLDDALTIARRHKPAALAFDLAADAPSAPLRMLTGDVHTAHVPLLVPVLVAGDRVRALGADDVHAAPLDVARLERLVDAQNRAPRVLVVHDAGDATTVVGALDECVMTEAKTAADALQVARTVTPDVVVVDLGAPHACDAIDALKADAHTRPIPIVAVVPSTGALLGAVASAATPPSLSREIALSRVCDALRRAGVGPRPAGLE